MASVFISYRHLEPDSKIANQFFKGIVEADHEAFLASDSIDLGDDWADKIRDALENCDYFLLLLSEKSLESDMVTEEVRRAKKLRDTRPNRKPTILPIRINLSLDEDINYDLAGYLNRIQQRFWNSNEDTERLLKEILEIINRSEQPQVARDRKDRITAKDSHKPLPNAPLELDVPAGRVSLQSKFYISRQREQSFIQDVLKPGALLRIKAPRQFGKTSLAARIIDFARKKGHEVVSLSFQLLDENAITNLDLLLKQLCAHSSMQLGLPVVVSDFWKDKYLGLKMKCSNYFENHILKKTEKPFVLAIDEADRLFGNEDVSSDFYSMLRVWNETATDNELWKKLKLIITYSTEANLSLPALQSPLNVGSEISLREFTFEEVKELAEKHLLTWNQKEINLLIDMIGGYPFLVRKAMYEIAKNKIPLESFLREASMDTGPYGDHLRRQFYILKQHPELEQELRFVIDNEHASDSSCYHRLLAGGLIKGKPSCVNLSLKLYQLYFKEIF